MRILLINWAPIDQGAALGGGVNGYCQSLALELTRRGHQVISLSGGTAFEASRTGSPHPGRCHIRPHPEWMGIRRYEVINSPVLAPSLAQFRDPEGEISAPALEEAVGGLAQEVAPDIVHFHNVEGFAAGCIPAMRCGHPGVRIFYSLHNYHTLCPQVYLMQGHRRPCFDYDNGHACRTCIPTVDPSHERIRAVAKSQGREIEPRWSPWPSPEPRPEPTKQPWWHGLTQSVRSTIARGAAVAVAEAAPAAPAETPWSQAWIERPARRPLLNIIQPEPAPSKPAAPWARRREAMVAMLNGCDQVFAVSRFVRDKFVAAGVRPERIQTLPIGTRMTELAEVHACTAVVPAPPPIRMVFMGYHNWYKGLPMLAESLGLLTPEYLRHIDLRIYALGGEQMEGEFRALEPHLAALTFQHGYRYEEIPGLLEGVHLGLVTSVWWDNAPQTVMEFLACGVPVLAAELGGIPDFVRDGENGLFFRGNDRWDLARRIAELVREPQRLVGLRGNIGPSRSIAEHVDELLHHYATPLS